MRAAEGHRVVEPATGCGCGRARPASHRAGADYDAPDPRGAEQLAPRQIRRARRRSGPRRTGSSPAFPGHLSAMTPCTWLTSLDSASIGARQLLALRFGHACRRRRNRHPDGTSRAAPRPRRTADPPSCRARRCARRGSAAPTRPPVCEPSTLALKSHRSVWLKMSSSPVILLADDLVEQTLRAAGDLGRVDLVRRGTSRRR